MILEPGRSEGAESLRRRADWIRLEVIRLIEVAGSGHYGSAFSAAEIIASLYYDVLRIDPANPGWRDRDRFILGKGHAAVAVYPCLADLGFFPLEWLDSYTRLGSPLGDHPDMTRVPGIDFSSGSIGHGLSVAVGIALGARLGNEDFVVYCLMGDGELNEGQTWEAVMAAAHFKLGRVIAVVDRNQLSLDGRVDDIMRIEPLIDKFRAFGWAVSQVDGHNPGELTVALASARHSSSQPTCIVADTQKGRGVSFMELAPEWHLGFLGREDRARAQAEIESRL